jgi:FkbH-like protein
MRWLPPLADFRAALREAQGLEPVTSRADRLAQLCQFRLSPLEVIQLDRAFAKLPAEAITEFAPLRLAVLGSSTMDHLLPGLRVAGLRRRLRITGHLGTYGQYRQEILDGKSPLYGFQPQIVLLSITAREVIASVPLTATAEQVDESLDAALADLRNLWRLVQDRLHATVIQQTFLNTAQPLFGSFDRLVPGTPARLIRRLNERLATAVANDGVAILDLAGAAEHDGLDAWFDAGRWLQGKMEIAPSAAPLYGELLARIVAAQRGLSKKCLVLDLDNTLWGGVVGDDGLDGIVLGEGSPTGEAHTALQRYALQLKGRGIVLAVCSKNEAGIAEEAFAKHPEMVLRRGDIACFIANWKPKATNLEEIAATLNLGLDSLVFVDDNPAERAAIRDALPMVAVPELPEDASQYVRCIAEAGYFEAVAFTAEDQQRADQYAANAVRAAGLQSTGSMDEFLSGLAMTTVYGRVGDVDLARVTQLINKTNQFNATTRRYTLEEVSRFCADPSCIALQFRLLDRLGDNGLVSVMLLRPAGPEPDVFRIDTWVMSCRVFGRELEFETMNIAVEIARGLGVRVLHADYYPTPKNGVIKDLYSSLGFVPRAPTASEPGATGWYLELDRYHARSTHIARRPN